MADTFPTTGLKVDLSELVQAREEYGRVETSINAVGEAAAKSAKNVDQANAQAMRMLRMRMSLTKQMYDEETRAAGMPGRAANMSAAEILAARRRLTAAMAAEADKQSKKEQEALAAANRTFRRMMDDRIAAGRSAADALMRQDQQTLEFNKRMWAQRAREQASASRNTTVQQFGPAGGLARTSLAEMAGLNRTLELGTGILGKFTGAFVTFRNVLGQVRSAVFDARTAIAVFAGAMVIGPVVHMADAMVALEARTRFYAQRASDVPRNFQAIYQTAQDARAPLEAVATLYTRLAPLAERLGRSQTQILRVAGTVAKGAAVGGATTEEARASSQQLAQALASNRLGGDELRSLAENAPILLSEIARSLGMNAGEFIKWAHEGKANAEIVIGAIEHAQTRIDAMFSQMPVTVGQAITVIGNAFQHFVGEVDRATNASTNFANSIVGFRAFLESEDTIKGAAAAVTALGDAFHLLHQGIDLIGNAAPAIATLIAVMVGARIIPGILIAINDQLLIMQALKGFAGVSYLSQGLTMVAAGAASARTALGGLVAMLGGPLGIALIAAAGAWSVYNANALDATETMQKFDDAQGNASSAIERAMGFVDRYGGSTKQLTEILLQLNGVQEDQVRGLDDAGRAAVARAENERRLTIALLARAAAEQTAAAASLRRSATVDQVTGFVKKIINVRAGRGGGANARVDEMTRESVEFKRTLAGELDAGAKQSLAAIEEVRNTKLNVTSPEDVKGGGSNRSTATTKGMSGAINAISKLRAEVEGLQREVNAVSADPLAALAAQIRKAAEVAEGGRTAGKGAIFQDEAGRLAAQKEELGIRLRLISTLAQQQHASEVEGAQAKITADANRAAAAALDAYYASGSQTWESYERALNAQADAALTAKQRQNELNIATDYGVTSVDQIAAAYAKATGASAADAQALQDHARKALDAANATDKQADSEDRLESIRSRLRSANEAVANQREDDRRELEAVQQTAQERAVADRTRLLATQIWLKALKEGKEITQQAAEDQARALALIEDQGQRMARLKIALQDSIRDAFINTGKLDFKNLRRQLTQSLRESIYDALLAKPINIVVNAAVNLLTQGLQSALSNILSTLVGGQNGTNLGNLLGATMRGDANGATAALNSLQQAGGSLGKAAQTLSSAVPIAAAAYAAYTVDRALSGSFAKLFGGDKKQVKNAETFGGFFGLVGGALGFLLGGKSSNHGVGSSRDSAGAFNFFGNKANEQTTGMAEALAKMILQGEDAIRGAGGSITNGITGFNIGSRDKTRVTLAGGQTITTAVGDPEAAAKAALLVVLKTATFADEAAQRFADGLLSAGKAFEDVINELAKYGEAQQFGRSIPREILKYRDPKAYAIANLQDEQKARRDQLTSYGAGGYLSAAQVAAFSTQLTELEGLELADVMKQFADGVNGATHSLAEFRDQQDALKKYIAGLLGGDLSPLGPEARLRYNADQFNQQAGLARNKDYDAYSGIQNYASTYLQDARAYYGSTQAYSQIFDSVKGTLDELAGMDFKDPVVTALSDASAAITQAVADGSAAVVAAVQESTNATNQQVAAQTEAIVNTTAQGFGGVAQAGADTAAFQAALSGGVA